MQYFFKNETIPAEVQSPSLSRVRLHRYSNNYILATQKFTNPHFYNPQISTPSNFKASKYSQGIQDIQPQLLWQHLFLSLLIQDILSWAQTVEFPPPGN